MKWLAVFLAWSGLRGLFITRATFQQCKRKSFLWNSDIPRQVQPFLHRQEVRPPLAWQEELHVFARKQFFNWSFLADITIRNKTNIWSSGNWGSFWQRSWQTEIFWRKAWWISLVLCFRILGVGYIESWRYIVGHNEHRWCPILVSADLENKVNLSRFITRWDEARQPW